MLHRVISVARALIGAGALAAISPQLAMAQRGGERASGPIAPRDSAMSEARFRTYVDSVLGSLAAKGWFSGSVLVARDGRVLFEKAYGDADRARNVANTLDTRFNVGSMNKMMTAVAIGQLAEQRRIALSDRVGRWLPTYPVAAIRDSVTIAQLLSHRSGMGSYWNDAFEREKGRIEGVPEYMALFERDSLLFAPGSRWEYSNAGFIVLGAIIERVTGRTYYDYVRDAILRPAGMTSTDFSAIRDSLPMRAVGYASAGDMPRGRADTSRPPPPSTPNWGSLPNRGGPAGGGYTTVRDLLRFDRALRSGKLLGKNWRDSLWTVRNADLLTSNDAQQRVPPYGYGFMVNETPGGTIVGHTGGAPGVSALLHMYLTRGETLAILSNQDVGLMLVRAATDAALSKLSR